MQILHNPTILYIKGFSLSGVPGMIHKYLLASQHETHKYPPIRICQMSNISSPEILQPLRIFCIDTYSCEKTEVCLLLANHTQKLNYCYSTSKYARNPLLQHCQFLLYLLIWHFSRNYLSGSDSVIFYLRNHKPTFLFYFFQ